MYFVAEEASSSLYLEGNGDKWNRSSIIQLVKNYKIDIYMHFLYS
jgi:hypothetical protein